MDEFTKEVKQVSHDTLLYCYVLYRKLKSILVVCRGLAVRDSVAHYCQRKYDLYLLSNDSC